MGSQNIARMMAEIDDGDFEDRQLRLVYQACKKVFGERGGETIDMDLVLCEVPSVGGDDLASNWLPLLLEIDDVRTFTAWDADLAKAQALIKAGAERRIEANALQRDNYHVLEADLRRREFEFGSQAATDMETSKEGFLEQLAEEENATKKPVTGIYALDETLGFMRPGQVLIIAGRPGMGKSTLGMNFICHIASQQGMRALVLSLEVTKEDFYGNIISHVAQANLRKTSNREWKRIDHAMAKMDGALIYQLDASEVKTVSALDRELSLRNYDCLMIDYLQLLSPERRAENAYQRITEISRDVKLLAQKHKIPVVLLSQLSRGSAKGKSDGPKMSHLRDSGAIEQDADVIMLIDRADDDEGFATIVIPKNRRGRTGTIRVRFNPETLTFSDLAEGLL